jgi:hypothetical protein
MSEKKVGSFEDLNIILLFLVSIFLTYIFYVLGLFFLDDYGNIFIFLLCMLIIFAVSNILGMVFNMGFYVVSFIKGSGKYTSILANLLFDYINLLAFHTRVLIQTIRIPVIYLTYFIFGMLYNELAHSYIYTDNIVYNYTSVTLYDYVILYIHIIIEVGHTLIIFGMQLIIFIFMVL